MKINEKKRKELKFLHEEKHRNIILFSKLAQFFSDYRLYFFFVPIIGCIVCTFCTLILFLNSLVVFAICRHCFSSQDRVCHVPPEDIDVSEFSILTFNLECCFTCGDKQFPRNYFHRQHKISKALTDLKYIPDFVCLPEAVYFSDNFDSVNTIGVFGKYQWVKKTNAFEQFLMQFLPKSIPQEYYFNYVHRGIFATGQFFHFLLIKPFISLQDLFHRSTYIMTILTSICMQAYVSATTLMGSRWKGTQEEMYEIADGHYVIKSIYKFQNIRMCIATFHMVPSHASPTLEHVPSMTNQIEDMINFVQKSDADAYILAGDLNCQPNTEEYKHILKSGFKSSGLQFFKEEPITCEGVFSYEMGQLMTLDYIFYKGDCLELQDCTVGEPGKVTDHSPLLAKFSISQ